MIFPPIFWVLLVGAYFFGATSFALIASKLNGIDLRQVGSGNLGATNVYRAMGFKWALVVFLLDLLKGFVPVWLATQLFPEFYYGHILVGCMAIVGHSFSFWVKFKGGKGAATGLGVLMALNPAAFGILFCIAAVMIGVTRIVSLTTITCCVLAPVLMFVFDAPQPYFIFVGVISGLIVGRHWSNIKRLIAGTENKV